MNHAYYEAEIQAVPTFIIGDTVIQGARPKEVLEQVIESELAKQKPSFDFQGMTCGPDGCS